MDCRFVLGILLLAACKAQLADAPDDAGTQPDANGFQPADAAMVDAQTMLGPWGTPARIPGGDSALDEDDPTLSSTRLELFFKRSDANDSNLYVMTRATTASAWGPPVALTVLNTAGNEESPRLTSDDLTLYFGRDGDIYRSTRAAVGGAWGAATAVTVLNTANVVEKWGVVCTDGYAMVSRAAANRGQDLYEGTIAAGANTAVPQLNSTSNEQGIFLSNDCLRVYYQSNRTNAQFDIYMATRTSPTAAWSNPTLLPDFNTATFSEEDPWISADQRTFVFASNSSGSKDLYISIR